MKNAEAPRNPELMEIFVIDAIGEPALRARLFPPRLGASAFQIA
jgi:hypothetical protein